MPRWSQITLTMLFSACAVLGCASKPGVPTCATSSECPASSRCIRQACVENLPPVASAQLPPGPLLANALLAFDGSGSFDPDPDDSVTSYAWTFRSVSAQCAAPTVAGTGPTAHVRFACAGSYAVDLTVEDELSYQSPIATVIFDVLPYYGPALVEAGPDVAVDHACSGVPLACAPTSPISLSATAPGATGPASFEWTARPPPGREGARATFAPDRFSASPTLAIESDGTAISGEWLLEVVARDDAGVLGTAVTRVSVRNNPPLVGANVPTPYHAFDGARLTADGEIAVSVSDPDGDPLPVREVAWHHSGDGTQSLFVGSDLGARITFAIVVPYSSVSDASFLIGGTGLDRSIELAVEDVNGARTREVRPIAVGNRPPVLVSSPAPFAVQHSFDAVDSAYEAVASLSRWSDPDGDPLAQVGSTGDGSCSSISVVAGLATASCSLQFAGTPAAANFAGTHIVTERMGDPWAQAPANAVTFEILNRAPTITSTSPFDPNLWCSNVHCCEGSNAECMTLGGTYPARTVIVPSRFADPDGDPLDVVAQRADGIAPTQPFVCTPPACDFPLVLATWSVCGTIETTLATTISDGAASASGSITVVRSCP